MNASDALHMEEQRILAMKKDTYKVRRAEGRPFHSQTSISILALGVLAWLANLVALAAPNWRGNWVGVMGYPAKRTWGLWQVVGTKTQFHHEMSSVTCGFYGQLNVGGICASPICLWYRTKCTAYMEMMLYSYTTGGVMIANFILHTMTLVWTAKCTPRLLRWAATWWPVITLIHILVVAAWYCMTEYLFDSLEHKSFYPTPSPDICVVAIAFSGIAFIMNTWLGCLLSSMWPEPKLYDSDEDESDEEDEDDDDDEDSKRKSKKAAAKGKAQQLNAQQQMMPQPYDPSQPMPYDPSQYDQSQHMVYDPSQQMPYDPSHQMPYDPSQQGYFGQPQPYGMGRGDYGAPHPDGAPGSDGGPGFRPTVATYGSPTPPMPYGEGAGAGYVGGMTGSPQESRGSVMPPPKGRQS